MVVRGTDINGGLHSQLQPLVQPHSSYAEHTGFCVGL